MTRRRTPQGFTLLEICVVVALAVLILGVAIPSMHGQMTRQRLQKSFDQMDALAGQARALSMKEGKPYLLAWDNDGNVRLYPAELSNAARRKQGPKAELRATKETGRTKLLGRAGGGGGGGGGGGFWPSGTCEPVVVEYTGFGGEWKAAYSALSGRGNLLRFIAQ